MMQAIKMQAVTILFACVATSALSATPDYVHVRQINYAGTGCPAGSVAENVARDRTAFTLTFDQFYAEVGPNVPFREKRKNCQITVDLDFPSGWSFTIVDVDYRGYAALEAGVAGQQGATYYFQGDRRSEALTANFYGPTDDNYHLRDSLGLSAMVWSPCGARRALNINTEVKLDNSQAPRRRGLLTLDSIDGQVEQIYGLRWKRC